LVGGMIDIAWNSPLAWLDTQLRGKGGFRAVAMRDTDRDRVTHLVARKGKVARLEDLRGRTIAMGAQDSPQATLIPIEHLRRRGLAAGTDYTVRRFDVLVGKHGDHVGGELEAFRALARGEAEASCMLDLNWQGWTRDGTVDPGEFVTVETTGRFDHCVFAVSRGFDEGRLRRWLEALFSMSYEDPRHREMMDLEGLKAWVEGRTSGFDLLEGAVQQQRFFAPERP
jgi:ABC-type phosphate/phosphonate transport system substrate-binding protein